MDLLAALKYAAHITLVQIDLNEDPIEEPAAKESLPLMRLLVVDILQVFEFIRALLPWQHGATQWCHCMSPAVFVFEIVAQLKNKTAHTRMYVGNTIETVTRIPRIQISSQSNGNIVSGSKTHRSISNFCSFVNITWSRGLVKISANWSLVLMGWNSIVFFSHMTTKMMIFDGNVLCSWCKLGAFSYLDAAAIIFKGFAMEFRLWIV